MLAREVNDPKAAKSGDYPSAQPALRDFIVGGWMALARPAKKPFPAPKAGTARVRRARKSSGD